MAHWLDIATKEQIEDAIRTVRKDDINHQRLHFEDPTFVLKDTKDLTDAEIISILSKDEYPYAIVLTKLDQQWPEICFAAVQQHPGNAHFIWDSDLKDHYLKRTIGMTRLLENADA